MRDKECWRSIRRVLREGQSIAGTRGSRAALDEYHRRIRRALEGYLQSVERMRIIGGALSEYCQRMKGGRQGFSKSIRKVAGVPDEYDMISEQ